MFLPSSTVEQFPVKEKVGGSNPPGGAIVYYPHIRVSY